MKLIPHTSSSRRLSEAPTVAAALQALGRCRTFLEVAAAAGILEDLEGDDALTVLAPADTAFDELGTTARALLRGGASELAVEVLEYHLIHGPFERRCVGRQLDVRSVQGEVVRLATEGLRLRVDDAFAHIADVRAGRSVVHLVSRVLSPRWGMPRSMQTPERWLAFERDRT